MRKDAGKAKTEISKLVVNGLRKTRVLRTLSDSQLMDQSRHDSVAAGNLHVHNDADKTGTII